MFMAEMSQEGHIVWIDAKCSPKNDLVSTQRTSGQLG